MREEHAIGVGVWGGREKAFMLESDGEVEIYHVFTTTSHQTQETRAC